MKSCTIIFSDAPDYVRDVLGHGGAYIYPPAEGTCHGCGILIRSNADVPLCCPHCRIPVKPTIIESFSYWVGNHSPLYSCKFINEAARRAKRKVKS